MALRSVVLEAPGPPAPRRTVVLRTGAPAPKGRVVDIVACILGILILLLAVALSVVLPDKTYVNPQFRLGFQDGSGELPSQSFEFVEDSAEVNEFKFEIPDVVIGAGPAARRYANIQTVTLNVGFQDDITYSHPDLFRLELLDPSGNVVDTHKDVSNLPPRTNETGFDTPFFQVSFTFQAVEHPQEAVVAGLAHTETKEQALARVEPDFRVQNHGVWTVRVTLLNAGDCPAAGEPEFNGLQAFQCRSGDPRKPPNDPTNQGSQDGTDQGNVFSVQSFRWSYYIPVMEELS